MPGHVIMSDGAIQRQGDSPAPQGVVFKARMSANQALTTGALTKINFNQKEIDPHGFYDTANSRFLPKIAGYYRVSATVYLHLSSGTSSVRIAKNGVTDDTMVGHPTGGADYNMPNGTTLVYLNGTTDYIEVQAHVTGTSPLAYGDSANRLYTHFSGELVASSVGVAPEPWHVVGAAGEPAFQNSWVNYGGEYAPARFFKDPYGIVHLDGLVKSGVLGGSIFTLPVGYRPAARQIYLVDANGAARVDVNSGGGVLTSNGTNGNLSISGITFRAEQ